MMGQPGDRRTFAVTSSSPPSQPPPSRTSTQGCSVQLHKHCISLYHRVVATRLQVIIEEGLEGQEYVSLLQWVLNTCPGLELMGSTALGLEKNLIPPLLTDAAVGRLTSSYLGTMRDSYTSWMTAGAVTGTLTWTLMDSSTPPVLSSSTRWWTRTSR